MATRKSIEKKALAERTRKQLERIEAEAQQELESEKRLLEETEQKINSLCEGDSLFCGIILSPEDILHVVGMAMKTKENIKIPFKLYFNN
jgi:precorrin-6B methylase 1